MGVGTGQPQREGCGGRRVPDTPGKCAWFWKSKGFTMFTTLIVFEVGRTCAEFAQSGYASTISRRFDGFVTDSTHIYTSAAPLCYQGEMKRCPVQICNNIVA